MNKISLSSGSFDLERYSDLSSLEVSGKTTLNAINTCRDLLLNVDVLDGAEFILNIFDFDEAVNHKINITSRSNSKVTINISFIAITDYNIEINANIDGEGTLSDTFIRGINESGNVNITLNGIAMEKCQDAVINEYAKVINTSSKANTLIPNLIVNTNEVTANHGVSIGSIDEEELFYLMSKGITKQNAIKIIEEGFILSIMDSEIRERIRNILLGR